MTVAASSTVDGLRDYVRDQLLVELERLALLSLFDQVGVGLSLSPISELAGTLQGQSSGRTLRLELHFRKHKKISYSSGIVVLNGAIWKNGNRLAAPFFICERTFPEVKSSSLTLVGCANTKALAILPLMLRGRLVGWLEAHYFLSRDLWSLSDRQTLRTSVRALEEHLLPLVDDAILSRVRPRPSVDASLRAALSRTHSFDESLRRREGGSPPIVNPSLELVGRIVGVRGAPLVFIRSDPDFSLVEAYGSVESVLGVTASQLVDGQRDWLRFFHADTVRQLDRRMRAFLNGVELPVGSPSFVSSDRPSFNSGSVGFVEDVKFVHPVSRKERFLELTVSPVRYADGSLSGWDVWCLDVTAKKEAVLQVKRERQRLQALFKLARAVQGCRQPEQVALQSLRALVEATRCSAGIIAFFNSDNEHSGGGGWEIVAAQGIRQRHLMSLQDGGLFSSLISGCIEPCRPSIIECIDNYSQFPLSMILDYSFRSSLVMPVAWELSGLAQAKGLLLLLSRRRKKFSTVDAEVVEAGMLQCNLALQQTELYAKERRRAELLQFHYQLGQVLSGAQSSEEIARLVLPLMAKEFSSKHMWMGELEPSHSRLAYLLEWKGGCQESDFVGVDDLVVWNETIKDVGHCKDIRVGVRNFGRGSGSVGEVESLVLVPLISLERCIGVMVFSPSVDVEVFIRMFKESLREVADEVARVVIVRKYENAMATAEKMRMACHLGEGVAHGINNVLQEISGLAEVVAQRDLPSSTTETAIRALREAVTRGATIVGRMRLITDREKLPDAVMTNLEDFLREQVRELYEHCDVGEQVELSVESALSLGQGVRIRPKDLQEVCQQLLSNSLRAVVGQERGSVKVLVTKCTVGSIVVAPEITPGEYACIEVRDNGCGMSEASLMRCFEPFFFRGSSLGHPNSNAKHGSGLGLSICYALLQRVGGSINVLSTPGIGTSVYCYVPLHIVIPENNAT